MRQALDSFDLERVEELKTYAEQVSLRLQQTAKTADLNNMFGVPGSPAANPVPQGEEGPRQESAAFLCPCGNLLTNGEQYCPKCGANAAVLQQNPMTQAVGSIKESQLPDEPQASQPGMNQDIPMPTAPNPAEVAAPTEENKASQDQTTLARTQIANEAAARQFSKIENLENAENVISALVEKYGLDENTIRQSLAIQARFGESVAVNGDITKEDINRAEFEEVNPGDDIAPSEDQSPMPPPPPQQPQGPPPVPPQEGPMQPQSAVEPGDFHKIEQTAKVPMKLIIDRISQDQGTDSQTAMTMLQDSWSGVTPPTELDVLVQGELTYFLPKSIVGTQDVTESPFGQEERPEDVMDQEFNNVPMQPAH